jgi:hypothetical protein
MKRKRKSKFSCSPWPSFMAWCPEDQRFEALASTMIVLAGEESTCFVSRNGGDMDDPDYVYVPQPRNYMYMPPREAVEVIRPDYVKWGGQGAYINDFRASSGRVLQLHAYARRDRISIVPGTSTLEVGFCDEPFVEGELLPPAAVRFKGIETPMEFDAGVAWFIAINDTLHILKRFCTSHPAITMGCCLEGPRWGAPLTGAASYHADGYPGRDLALSWIHLHDKDPLDLAVGWTIDALRERVEASPPHSSIWIVDEDRITREHILAALDVPCKTLVETLDAAAKKFHPTWDSMMNAGFGTYLQALDDPKGPEKEAFLVTEEHIKLIEECSPAYVMHLDNNGLILCAHPDRTLWPLWSSALDLLGIRPQS